MSLKSKIAAKKFYESEVPTFKAKVEEILGKTIELEFDHASFDLEIAGNWFFECPHSDVLNNFQINCFDRVYAVLQEMCAEEMMKEFLVDNLHKVVVSSRDEQKDTMLGGAEFKDGALHFRPVVEANVGTYNSDVEKKIFDAFNNAA